MIHVININHIDPDILFFAGDQSYDHQEHTAAWLKFGMQFRETFRERPCITIPDDHDIGQGNLWGESGKIASSSAGNGNTLVLQGPLFCYCLTIFVLLPYYLYLYY